MSDAFIGNDVFDAPAKLTLSLRITGVRDDGYHLIDSEMVTLALGDTVAITPGATGVSCDGPYAAGVPTDERNLVNRALDLCGRRAAVHVFKAIPPAVAWAEVRPTPPQCCDGPDGATSKRRRGSVPTCRSAWSAGEPG